MGYSEAVYYMLNGGMNKYIIEKLEITDSWKGTFQPPGYGKETKEECVGWDEVTVEVPTTDSVTVTKDSTTYTPVAPSKGYKQVKVQIPYGGSHTFNQNGDWTFGVDTEFATEAYKTLTAAVPIKNLDSRTENHTTWTYPDGSGNIGVKSVDVNVKIYTQKEIDDVWDEVEEWKEKTKKKEDECPVNPKPVRHTPGPTPYPIEDPPIELFAVFPDKEYKCGNVSFEIIDDYVTPTLQSEPAHAVYLYNNGTRSTDPVYYDMCVIVRWKIKGQIVKDDVVRGYTANDDGTHRLNYYNHWYSRTGSTNTYHPGLSVDNFTYDTNYDRTTATVDLSVFINDWESGWGGSIVWSGRESTYGIYDDPVKYPTGRPAEDCYHDSQVSFSPHSYPQYNVDYVGQLTGVIW